MIITHNKARQFAAIVSVLNCMGSIVFFSMCALFGYHYTGSENTSIYIVYTIIVALASYCIFLLNRQNKRTIFALLLPIIILICYVFDMLLKRTGNTADYFFRCFLLWALPAFLAGSTVWKMNNLYRFVKLIDPCIILFSIYILNSMIAFLINGRSVYTATGTTYQEISYVGALTFGLNILTIIRGKEYDRFRLFRSKLYQIISYFLLIPQAGIVLIAGGRGAFVEIIAFLLFLLLPVLFSRKRGGVFLGVIMMLAVGFFLFQLFISNSAFVAGIARLQRIFNTNGLMNESRYDLYNTAISLFNENHLFGYGVFGQFEVIGRNVHNVILEMLLGTGILGFAGFCILFLAVLRKQFRLRKYDCAYRVFDIILIAAIVNLMFSGTWLASNQLWFCFGFLLPCPYTHDLAHVNHDSRNVLKSTWRKTDES